MTRADDGAPSSQRARQYLRTEAWTARASTEIRRAGTPGAGPTTTAIQSTGAPRGCSGVFIGLSSPALLWGCGGDTPRPFFRPRHIEPMSEVLYRAAFSVVRPHSRQIRYKCRRKSAEG